MRRIYAILGDITREKTDAIVNAANTALLRGSGVCGAIFTAAGPDLSEECKMIGYCAPGDAVTTGSCDLAARGIKNIIHGVGPVWFGGSCGERELLTACYLACLREAGILGARSVSFPVISAGIYGYPLREAACVAVNTLKMARTSVERIRIVTPDRKIQARIREQLAWYTQHPRHNAWGLPDE